MNSDEFAESKMEGLPSTTESHQLMGVRPILITMDDLQRMIGCGKTTAFAIVGRGEIETVQIGRKRMAVVESVEGYVDRLRQAQRPAADAAPLAEAS